VGIGIKASYYSKCIANWNIALHYIKNVLSALNYEQTAKALKSVKVKRTKVMQGKKQKISMILNENKKQAK